MSATQTYVFRMVHIDNVPHILEHGITHQKSPNANHDYKPIGDSSIIKTRNQKTLTFSSNKHSGKGKILIGDLIPFYFGCRTPMLYVIQKGFNGVAKKHPKEIIYLVCSIESISVNNPEFFFTDGHANDALSSCYDETYAGQIHELVDVDATKILDWTVEPDAKRKKEAEFLVLGDIPASSILGFICYNNESHEKLLTFGIPANQIRTIPARYFNIL